MKRNKRFILLLLIMLVVTAQGNVLSAMEKTEITAEESYRIGLSEEDFCALAEHAHLVRPDLSVTGFEVLAMRGKDVRSAKTLYRRLLGDFEWAPCDPAKQAAVLRCREHVFRVKGSAEEVNAFIRHMSKNGRITKRILINNT